MNNVLPARIGEFVRAHLGGAATKQSRSIVLATIAGERLADGLMISFLFATLYSLESTHHQSEKGYAMYMVALFFAAAGVGTLLALLLRERIFGVLERFGKVMPGHLSSYTLTRLRRFAEGLMPMFRPSRAVGIGLMSAVVWGLELLIYFAVTRAFGQDLTIGELSLFMAAVNFSSLIPAAPAGAGVIELIATQALVEVGVPRGTAFSMVALQHLTQFVVVGLPGLYYFFFGLGGKIPEGIEESSEDDAPEVPDYVDVSDPNAERPVSILPTSSTSGNLNSACSLAVDVALPSESGVELDLSVVIPAYNEESRLPKTLLSVYEYLHARQLSYEIIVVDDGSSDETSTVVKQFVCLTNSVKLISYPQNRGKGFAVRSGILASKGRLVLFNDADGATPIAELERLETAISNGAQVAIGSRAMVSRDAEVKTVWYRKFIGRIFNALVNLLILPGIADTQCGFKLFTRRAALFLFGRQRAERFSFDVEILYLARRTGLRIAEVPINWTNVPGSKVDLALDSARMLRDVLLFRARGMFGRYGVLEGAEIDTQDKSIPTAVS